MFIEEDEFDCDDKPTDKFDFSLVPILYDWLNCLPDKFGMVIDDFREGGDAVGWEKGSLSGVLHK